MATLDRLENGKVKLTIEVDAEKFSEAMQASYIKNVKNFNVQGFRRGKVPRKVVESIYGEGVLYDDAIDFVYADACEAAFKEHDVELVEQPQFSLIEIGSGKPLVFSIEFAAKPEVTLGEYKGIEVPFKENNVTEKDVDAAIELMREKLARYVDVESAIENGDRIIFDYSGSIDGKKYEGGTAEDQTLTIGSGQFIPGFEEQLVGKAAGFEGEINVKFPDEYHAEELKGKDAVFAIKIKRVQKKELPELDDEFAQEVSEFETLAELREDKRKSLIEIAELDSKAKFETEAIKKAVGNSTVEIPDAMIERELTNIVNDISYRLSANGISLEEYMKHTGVSEQSIRDEYREDAKNRVKTELTLEAIAKAENITSTEEELDEKLAQYSKGEDGLEKFKATLRPQDLDYFRELIVREKTVKFITDNAVKVAAE